MEKNPRKQPSRIFLLDAHEATRRGLARLIESEADLRVCGEAVDVEEALAAIPSARPDAAVLGFQPLDEAGPSAVDRLRWIHPGLPLIVVSLKEVGGHGRKMMQAGVAGYVTTARASRDIVPAIRRVLKGGIYSAARMSNRKR